MVVVHQSLSAKNEWAFVYSFFSATMVDNLFDRRGVKVGSVGMISEYQHGFIKRIL